MLCNLISYQLQLKIMYKKGMRENKNKNFGQKSKKDYMNLYSLLI